MPADNQPGSAVPFGFPDAQLAVGGSHTDQVADPLVDVERALVVAGGFV
jgi:hypothetical protein